MGWLSNTSYISDVMTITIGPVATNSQPTLEALSVAVPGADQAKNRHERRALKRKQR